MLPRAARRLETTLLSSRQSLPRPARLYSTPSKKVNAPALATVQVPRPDYPPFLAQPPPQSADKNASGINNDLESFLSRRMPYTILPTPLPSDRSSLENERWFTDSATQDLTAVMDACIHNLHDVPRAKVIFEQLRANEHGSITLDPRVYNALLEAYINLAISKKGDDKEYWVTNAWELYQVMERGEENMPPTEGTYALMFRAWHLFHSDPETAIDSRDAAPPVDLLARITDRQLSVSRIISDRSLSSSEEAVEIIKSMSKAAVDLNLPKVLVELGQAEALGAHYSDVLEDVPEVKPVMRLTKSEFGEVTENGEEVKPKMEVPFNLDNLRRHLADVTLARRVLPEDVAARQKMLEESVYDVAVERLKHQADLLAGLGLDNSALMQADLRQWMWDWHVKLKERLEEEIRAISAAEMSPRYRAHQLLSPYLSLVKAERLSLITILEIMRLSGAGGISDGMKTTRALISVGKAVEIEYKAQMCKSNNIPIPTSKHNDRSNFFSNLGYSNLQQRRVAAAKHMTDGETWTAVWTQAVRSKLGGILVECLMDVAEVTRTAIDPRTQETVSEAQPAFFHSYEYQRGQKLGVIRLNPVVVERLAKDNIKETLHPRHLPMLVKPKPWLNYDQGGYLYNKSYAMRFKDSVEQQVYLKQASQLGNVELVYAGLDVLGSTPWKVNRKVFDVVLKVWNTGERMGKIPPAAYDQPEPLTPENYETDMKARSIYLQRQKSHLQAKASNHSERCGVNYKIEIARAFLGDTMYLPHNLDFRGRAYPIPPHLNHIGDDLCRGLLLFDDAKPLGDRGLRWLKIHLANLYGYDKASFDEREEWVMERLEEVYDSAIKPLDGRRWWTQASDPWQCLATCFELHAALESEDPEAFMSTLPVHQDGTCNGLQHYAALGGDDRGAQQVNLAAADRPSDVYSHVGSMVEKMIEDDVKKGMQYAILLKGKITRKVVKQTVMTTVYGVTFIGAREQIEKQLKDRKDIPEEECWNAAAYLAKLVLSCIGDLFTGATSIQNWLNLCARLISKSIPEERLPEALAQEIAKSSKRKGTTSVKKKNTLPSTRLKKEQMTSVIWTTPLGLPIVQPYRKTARKQIMTSLQSVYISDPNSPAEVNSLKQASAFPPNFIHSLDATHMMLTALECRSQGLTFASVHDSYWTHACSIDKMSGIIRDTFIALHSSDVLARLQQEFVERYKGYKVPLENLRSANLIKSMREAGAKIVATSEQAKSLSSLGELVTISDTEKPTVAEAEAMKNMAELKDLLSDIAEDGAAKTEKETVDEAFSDEMMEEDEYLSPHAKTTRARKLNDEKAALELMGKFVNLTDILPPLPKKGNFKVERIKESQYFFS